MLQNLSKKSARVKEKNDAKLANIDMIDEEIKIDLNDLSPRNKKFSTNDLEMLVQEQPEE